MPTPAMMPSLSSLSHKSLYLNCKEENYLIKICAKALEMSCSIRHISKFLMRQLAIKSFLSVIFPLVVFQFPLVYSWFCISKHQSVKIVR